MKNDVVIAELFDDEAFQEGISKVVSLTEDFASLSEQIGLDRKCDFQNSNLRNVDFSYSDLRGFNFSGSDLSDSFGLDVLVDDTTCFHGATVEGSIFEKRIRETEFFAQNTSAGQLYKLLKEGDAYDVSIWVSTGQGNLPKRLLKNIGTEEVAILCQKLVVDDIDLTKRTTLFYHLRQISESPVKLRALVSDFLAFHLENPKVVRAFVKVSGGLFAKDQFITKAILRLCTHKDISVKQVAFTEIIGTNIFEQHYSTVLKLFLSPQNTVLRQRLIMETALKLGRSHLRAVAKFVDDDNLGESEVYDYGDLLKESTARRISGSQIGRKYKQTTQTIIERQEEVLAQAPFFSHMLWVEGAEWLLEAQKRLQYDYNEVVKDLTGKIDNAYARSRS